MEKDIEFMVKALELAREAYAQGEIPVGAVVVKDGVIVGKGYNLREREKNALLHAEVVAIEDACRTLGAWRLTGCELYVTMEPCPMCAGAVVNSRISRVVYGVSDAMAGCCGSVINLASYPLGHTFEICRGVLEHECQRLLKDFFSEQRGQKKEQSN